MELAQSSIFERLNNWIRESIMVKLVSIGFLTLILLIPQSSIEGLIRERQYRAQSVIDEVASKWSGEQNLSGPVLVIPYLKRERIDKGKDGYEVREWKENAYFLPEDLKVEGQVDPQILHRGIFDAAVYEAALNVKAHFAIPDFEKLTIAENDVLWKESHLVVGISDLRGISKNPVIQSGGQNISGEPSNAIGLSSEYGSGKADGDEGAPAQQIKSSESGIVLKLPWTSKTDFNGDASVQLDLKGSTQLYFTPVGKTTEVTLKSSWPNPSFDGEFLPAQRDVNEKGFSATWRVLHFNRPFSQQWTGDNQKLTGADFGVRLVIPVDQYQKSTRTAKYGILVILLTFISLFMVEIIRKIRIHPFQYILVGVALIIYYTLLLSLSEHVGYDVAYAMATAATVVLIVLYASTFLTTRGLTWFFGGLLLFFYGFIFVIIQLQDYSLLLGSVGLFMTVGLIMYFSRKIDWYKN